MIKWHLTVRGMMLNIKAKGHSIFAACKFWPKTSGTQPEKQTFRPQITSLVSPLRAKAQHNKSPTYPELRILLPRDSGCQLLVALLLVLLKCPLCDPNQPLSIIVLLHTHGVMVGAIKNENLEVKLCVHLLNGCHVGGIRFSVPLLGGEV